MELLLLLIALFVAFLVFTWLVKVVRATISLAIAIALVIVVLGVFGIGPGDLWDALANAWSRFR